DEDDRLRRGSRGRGHPGPRRHGGHVGPVRLRRAAWHRPCLGKSERRARAARLCPGRRGGGPRRESVGGEPHRSAAHGCARAPKRGISSSPTCSRAFITCRGGGPPMPKKAMTFCIPVCCV